MDIVKQIYIDIPVFLHSGAAQSVRSHLHKLRNEKRVVQHENAWGIA
jgi:hypothetical protein